jgi:prepilin-type processing-associated H-X9-DG protein/prepilin-type N-terminal cleavage/methylation domain-containing protein
MQTVRLSRRVSPGFTLVELGVVIAIIALLVSLLLPALMRAKEDGRTAVCRSNMRQIMLGVFMYADDNDDYFPWPGGLNANQPASWVISEKPRASITSATPVGSLPPLHAEAGSVFTHVTGLPRVGEWDQPSVNYATSYAGYRCPSTGALGYYRRVTYSLNSYLGPGLASSFAADPWPDSPVEDKRGVRRAAVIRPGQKVLLVDDVPENPAVGGFMPTPPTPEYFARHPGARHNGRVNLAFMDGHLGCLTYQKMMEMLADPYAGAAASFEPFSP